MIEFAPKSKHMITYEEAILYCQFLNYNGHRDWRMPTYDELDHHMTLSSWWVDDPTSCATWYATPVRDVC